MPVVPLPRFQHPGAASKEIILDQPSPIGTLAALRNRMSKRLIAATAVLLGLFNATPAPASFLNVSTRVDIPQPALGEDVTSVIGGFIIGGNVGRKLVIRALGPSLAQFGLVPLADPVLQLYDSTGAVIATNDNWMDSQEQEILDSGLAPNNPLESAILMVLPPGAYTAIVQGNSPGSNNVPGSGTGLVEVYDISLTIGTGLDNISTRGAVQSATDPMIVGFVVGNGDEDSVLIRGLGPSLKDLGLAGLSDPRLDLFDTEGNLLASNDNWQDTQSAEIEATGLAPTELREPAILITLPRGSYTAVLSPAGTVTHGVALAEVYRL